jgi:hypothetical protein
MDRQDTACAVLAHELAKIGQHSHGPLQTATDADRVDAEVDGHAGEV